MPSIAVHVTPFKHYLLPPHSPLPVLCWMSIRQKGPQMTRLELALKLESSSSMQAGLKTEKMLPPANFVCWFHIYFFHQKNCLYFTTIILSSLGCSHVVFLLLKNRKRIGHDITYTCATHADLARDITDTSQTQNGNLLRAMFYNFQMLNV